MAGKTIKIFLVDGVPTGLKTAELSLSVIKGVFVPRASLESLEKREEGQKTGVYILIGPDDDKIGFQKVYMGEADVVIQRLKKHDSDDSKDFWEKAVFFISKDENLTKAHVRYLEAKLIAMTKESKLCNVINGTAPIPGKLPECDIEEMEEFLKQAGILLGTLGINILDNKEAVPKSASPGKNKKELELFYKGDGFEAQCIVDSAEGNFVVKKGSKARLNEAPALNDGTRNLRRFLIEKNVWEKNGTGYLFKQDHPFSSVSTTAQVVSGTAINGKIAWKLKDGSTYKQFLEEKLKGNEDDE
jgi:hypothetical protein